MKRTRLKYVRNIIIVLLLVPLAALHMGVFVFVFDQNIVGRYRVSFRGKAGQTVELQYGEMRDLDGPFLTGNLCVVSQHRAQLDLSTFHADGIETFEPRIIRREMSSVGTPATRSFSCGRRCST